MISEEAGQDSGGSGYADGGVGGEKQVEPRCILDLRLRGLSVGLDVERILAFGGVAGCGVVPLADMGKTLERAYLGWAYQ